MKLFVVAVLCAFGLVQSRIAELRWLEEKLPEYVIQETVFRNQREYQFVYNGQLLTGIPSSSRQHSGHRIQALVSLVVKSPEVALLRINHIRMGKLNRPIPNPRTILPFMVFEHAPISEDLLQPLRAPVRFSYVNGMISNIVFDGTEQAWSANIKRGILNLLQVNLKRQNVINVNEEALALNEVRPGDPTRDFFRVMENTLEGECETLYTVVSEPHPSYTSGPVLNVSKTINFESCVKRPHIKYNFRFSDPCPSCNRKYNSDVKERFLKSSSVFSFNISGTPESFLIERANVESQYVLVPFNAEGNVVITYVNQTLVLVRSGQVESNVVEPRNPIPSDSQMIYTPDWDVMKEKFFLEGDDEFHTKTPYPEITNNVEFVTSVFRKLISNIREQVEDSAPRYFDSLVVTLRIMKRQELERIWKQLFVQVPENFTPEQHKKVKSFLVDAMASAGTRDTVVSLIEKIKSRQIPPIMASFAIKSFINIRVVSREMINELLSLAESDICRRVFFLRQSVFLTLGSMINALCSPNEDLLAVEFKVANPQVFCPREFKQRFVQLFFQRLRSSDSWEDKVLFMKTISNAGLDLSIFELENIIRSGVGVENSSPTFFRVEAVLALRQLKDFMPRKVQKVLMPVFMNRFEPPELRIVSAYQILQTLPERPVLDQIARRLFVEPSRQVTSFVFSYMHTMSNSSNPCERRLATDMQLSLRHSRFPPFTFSSGYSKLIHKSIYSRKYDIGVDMDLATAFSNTSYVPRRMAINVHPIFGGFWAKHFATIGFASEGFEQIFWKYFGERGFFFEKPLEEILRRSARSVRTRNPSEELKELFNSLRIRPREYFPRHPKAFFYLKFKDQEFGFLPFSLDSLPDEVTRMFQQGQFSFRRVEQILENGHNFYFTKGVLLHELSYKIPTSLGVPLRYRASVPTVMSITGQLKPEFEPNRRLHYIRLVFREFKPSLVSTFSSNVESWSPVVNTGLRVIVKAKFFYPITGRVQLDMKQSPMEFKLNFVPPTRPVQMFSLETRPITYTFLWPRQLRVWQPLEEVTVTGEDWTRVNRFNRVIGEYLLGIKMRVVGRWHRTPTMKLVDTPICPLSGPNRLQIYTEPGYQMPKELVLKLSGNFFQPLSEEIRPEFTDFQTSTDSYEEFTPEILESLKQVVPVDPTQHMLKIEVLAKGSSVPRRFSLEKYLKCDRLFRYCKFTTRMERSPIPRVDSQPFKLCLDGESLFPTIPHTFSELVGKKAIAQLKMSWGPTCQSSDRYIHLNVISGRSERQVELERVSPEFRFFSEPSEDLTVNSPVFQHEHLYRFAHLMEYSYDMQYSRVPVVVQNMTNFVFRLLKHKFFWQTQVAQIHVRNPQNRIRGLLSLDPLSRQYCNLTVKTPVENTTFLDVPIRLPLVVSPVNIRHSRPILSFLDDVVPTTPFVGRRPTCHVSSRYVKTFDTVKYSVPFSSCWTVLVKDCGNSEQPNFGVYMQKVNDESELKRIKIVTTSHRIVLVPESESYESVKIQYNGQSVSPVDFEPILDHGHVIARVDQIGQYIKVSLPETGLSIYFDGYSVNIKTTQLYRNVVCGLCGHYDNEPSDEFRLPNNELVEDVREFYRSYVLPGDSCTVPEISDICSTPSCQSSPMTPIYCPVCKYVVRQGLRETELTKPELKEMITNNCDQYPSLGVSCRRFFHPLTSKVFLQIKEGRSEEEICSGSVIGACSPEVFSVFESESFPYSPKPEFQSFEPAFPVLRTKVLEQDHQYCFSKVPVPVCPHHAYAQTFKPEKRVVYSCLSRDDPQAETLSRRLVGRFVVLSEVTDLPASFTETEIFPETCSPLV